MVVRSVIGWAKLFDYKSGSWTSYFEEIAMLIETGSDPRVCPFCTLMLPNAPALVRHFNVAHGEFVQDTFEPQVSGMLSESTLRHVEAEAVLEVSSR